MLLITSVTTVTLFRFFIRNYTYAVTANYWDTRIKTIFRNHPGKPDYNVSILDFIVGAKDDGSDDDSWSYKTRKAPVKYSPYQETNTQIFTGRIPFLSPNQQCQSTEG